VRSLLLFVPALFFGLVAVVSSALAFAGDEMGDREEAVLRNRRATRVAVVAAVLCGLTLVAGAGLFVLQLFPLGD
jgi:hypothetical protein